MLQVLVLPLLPFLPSAWEAEFELHLRKKVLRLRVAISAAPGGCRARLHTSSSARAHSHLLLRARAVHSQVIRSELPLGLVWLLPSGRFALWLLATFILALLVTGMTPFPTALGWQELALFAYMVGWTYGEYDELLARTCTPHPCASSCVWHVCTGTTSCGRI